MSKLKFPKGARLTKAAEFRLVKEKGQVFQGRYLTIGVLGKTISTLETATDASHPLRLGIITTKRLGNACQRTRSRRWIREIVRISRPRWTDDPRKSFQIVIVARPSIARASFRQLKAEWDFLGTKAGLLR